MAYKRYIKKNGKKIGPYYYKSIRKKSGKIRTVYLGTKNPERKRIFDDLHHMKFVLFIFMFLGAVFIALNPHTVGFVVKSSQIYTDDISLVINETQTYNWNISYAGMRLIESSINNIVMENTLINNTYGIHFARRSYTTTIRDNRAI
jgi:parallel beta-helix repeat protein